MVTQGDIKKASSFIFNKYNDLIDWFKSKNPGANPYTNAKKLLAGVHVFRIGDRVGIAINWNSGRAQNTPWVATSYVFEKEVVSKLESMGIEAYDVRNSYYDERTLKASLKIDSLDNYKFIKNDLLKDIVENNTVTESIKILTS